MCIWTEMGCAAIRRRRHRKTTLTSTRKNWKKSQRTTAKTPRRCLCTPPGRFGLTGGSHLKNPKCFHFHKVVHFDLTELTTRTRGVGRSGKPVEAVPSQASVGHSGGFLGLVMTFHPMLADESGKFLLRRIIFITEGNI